MSKLNLKYLKDTEDNFILKKESYDLDYEGNFATSSGDYSNNILLSSINFEKSLEHQIDDIVKDIEENIMMQNYARKEDVLSEVFTAVIKTEEDFNPLFQHMSKGMMKAYTRGSRKVHIDIHFEICFKASPYLYWKTKIKNFFHWRKLTLNFSCYIITKK